MNIKLRLVKDYGSNGEVYKTGEDLEVSKSLADQLIADGFAVTLDSIEAKQAEDDRITRIATAAAEATVKRVKSEAKGANLDLTVKDAADLMKFKNIGEQLFAVRKAHAGDRESVARLENVYKVATASGLNEGINSEGAFLVQTDIQQNLEQSMFETGQLLGMTQQIPLSANSNALEYNQVSDYNRTDGNRRGGITVARTHEAGSATASKPAIERQRIQAEKLTGLYYATDELLEDSTALASLVDAWFGEEFGYVIDDEIVRGNGGGEMLGMLNSSALVTVTAVSGQGAGTFITENADAMFARMNPRSIASGKARWLVNQDALPQINAMSQAVGTAGGTVVFRPNGNVSSAPFGMMLGIPIMPIEQCSTLGTVGDVILADLSQYKVVTKGGLVSASSIHVKFVEGETAFRFSMRINGQPSWRTACTPANGSNTISPFVALSSTRT